MSRTSPDRPPVVPVSTALRPETVDAVRRLAQAEGRTVSAYLRRLIELHLPGGAS